MEGVIGSFLNKTENIALILSFIVNCGLAWFVVFLMREGREERSAERQSRTENVNKTVQSLDKLADAVNNWRVEIVRGH
jgi:hypothetical protein